VQQAHLGRLALLRHRQRVDDRADQHLEQAAADRVHHHRAAQAQIGRGQHGGGHGKQHQAEHAQHVGEHQRPAVADPVHHPDGDDVGQ